MKQEVHWLNCRPLISIKAQGVYSENPEIEFLCFLNEAIVKRLKELECTQKNISLSGWVFTEKEWMKLTTRKLETMVQQDANNVFPMDIFNDNLTP